MRQIDSISCIPLFIECFFNNYKIGCGTGFFVKELNNYYLITNWHVVTGRDSETKEPLDRQNSACDPDSIKIYMHAEILGNWKAVIVTIRDIDGNKKWLEHPDGNLVDVVAIPLNIPNDVKVYPLEMSWSLHDLMIVPSDPVSIVGFPFGKSVEGRFPIWKTGHIASDIDLDYDHKPVFLIDSTTRQGMSGSPVIARRRGIYQSTTNKWIYGNSEMVKFLGIYSGRLNNNSEIGRVWKPSVLNDIIGIL